MGSEFLDRVVAQAKGADDEIARLEQDKAEIDETLKRLRAFKRWAVGEEHSQKKRGKRRDTNGPPSDALIRRVAEECLARDQREAGASVTNAMIARALQIHPTTARKALIALRDREFLRKAGRSNDRRVLYAVYPDAQLPELQSTTGDNNGKA